MRDRRVRTARINDDYRAVMMHHSARLYYRFDELTKRRDSVDAGAGIEALTVAVESYRGEVAHAIERANKLTEAYESLLRPFREDYWRRVIDAHQSLGELLRSTNQERALDILDRSIHREL